MEKIRRVKSGGKSRFEDAFKRKVVLEYHHGSGPLKPTAIKYGIDRTTLANWIRWYEAQANALSLEGMVTGAGQLPDDVEQPDIVLGVGAVENELSEVKSDDPKVLAEVLRLAQIKLACLEKLIDLTEQQLGIEIRKNAGTKSSVK